MKATLHCGKNGSANHNDRNFDYINLGDQHIDPSRVKDNIYQSYKNIMPFEKAEEQFYKDQYTNWINRQNEENKKSRHPQRKKTVKSLLKGKYTKPDEIILQIGNRKEHPDAELFSGCVLDFVKAMAPYAENFHIIDVAIHKDEETPHAHIRGVWDYVDEYGDRHISQSKGLEALGIEPPHPELETSIQNNRKTTFHAQIRRQWYDICEERGVKIDRTPIPENNIHLTKPQLIISDLKKENEQLREENLLLKEHIRNLEKQIEDLQREREVSERTR